MPMDNTTAHTHGGGYSGRPVMAGAEPSPAVPSSKCSGRMQSMLLESAGQGRLDSIVSLMDLAPNILDSKGQYGEWGEGEAAQGCWLLADPTPPAPLWLPLLSQIIRARERAEVRPGDPSLKHRSTCPPGISAAHIAAYYGHWHVLQFLAKKNTQHLFAEADDGGTPAHHAAAAGRTGAGGQGHAPLSLASMDVSTFCAWRYAYLRVCFWQRRSSSWHHRASRTW